MVDYKAHAVRFWDTLARARNALAYSEHDLFVVSDTAHWSGIEYLGIYSDDTYTPDCGRVVAILRVS